MNHYKLTSELKKTDGGFLSRKSLYRIEALVDGPWGPAGTKGGFVESEKNLEQGSNAWVGNEACVCDKAYVSNEAWVSENAVIFNHARVSESARVSGNAMIFEDSCIGGNAQVSGNAIIFGNVKILMNAKVSGRPSIGGNVIILDDSEINAIIKLDGKEIICGNMSIKSTPQELDSFFKKEEEMKAIFARANELCVKYNIGK